MITGSCAIDLSSPLDCIDHTILLEKLKLLGFDNLSVSWITSYMTGRKQRVEVCGHLNDFLTLIFGVRRGSILGPLLLHIGYN